MLSEFSVATELVQYREECCYTWQYGIFADIKGSMELIEDLDPEEARAIVDPALKLMMDAVHHYGGYVAQSTGDGILAARKTRSGIQWLQRE
jgi:hypothetical protein